MPELHFQYEPSPGPEAVQVIATAQAEIAGWQRVFLGVGAVGVVALLVANGAIARAVAAVILGIGCVGYAYGYGDQATTREVGRTSSAHAGGGSTSWRRSPRGTRASVTPWRNGSQPARRYVLKISWPQRLSTNIGIPRQPKIARWRCCKAAFLLIVSPRMQSNERERRDRVEGSFCFVRAFWCALDRREACRRHGIKPSRLAQSSGLHHGGGLLALAGSVAGCNTRSGA